MIPYSTEKLQQYFLQDYNIAVTLQNVAATLQRNVVILQTNIAAILLQFFVLYGYCVNIVNTVNNEKFYFCLR